MSELVRKMHTLRREVFDLEQSVLHWKSMYAAEVNHAEELAQMMAKIHLPCGKAICSMCNLLDDHEQRRVADLGIAQTPESGPAG